MGKWYRLAGIVVLIAVILGGVRACQLINQQPITEAGNTADETAEPGLTLKDVTLEQPDEDGNLLWRVHADEVTYSPDQKVATVINPDGELFQDGEVIYRVKADRGEVRQDGQSIFLKNNIVATGVQNKVVLKGQELEWQPEEDLMVVRNQITGTHPQLKASAQEARVYNRERRLELSKNVVASTTEAPFLRMAAEELTWLIDAQRVESDRPIQVEQLKNDQVSDRVTGQQGEVDLAKKVVKLTEDVKLELLELPLEIFSQVAVWNVEQAQVVVPDALQANQPEQKVQISANRGELNLNQQVVYLTQGVNVVEGQQSQLQADSLTWNLESQQVVAEGNVNYRQSDPPVQVQGPRAVGQLDEETVVISGGRVVTEITP
ncbi:LPS export ABC transporter periplasmic protein LptC [Almyronema epifaneia]|uniref:LPS export ABC transporter periplasmic protein LptC n=1 Tax=Almyronema epifaneia S1 TaxID=2991925 RepID=A0ABW6I964_9CYAN